MTQAERDHITAYRPKLSDTFPYLWICSECAKGMLGSLPANKILASVAATCKYCKGFKQITPSLHMWTDYDWPQGFTKGFSK